MAEDGVPEVLQADRLGHIVPGIRGVYTHVSDAMRDELKRNFSVAGKTLSMSAPIWLRAR
ncbi:hypothetical protein G3I24_35455, partial [Micromonospora aurantiaca]|nr:hypothetical protein [Micromonospora aurantiaca]